MKTTVFWNVSPRSLVEVYRLFRGNCCLHHQDDDDDDDGGSSMFACDIKYTSVEY
jgi:hypothetical protein